MKRFALGLLSLVALGQLPAKAYIVATRTNDPIDFRASTAIIIAGRGKELQRQFQEAAISQANRYAQVLPGRQVVLVFAREYKNDSDLRFVEANGFRIKDYNNNTFTAKMLFTLLERFSSISSMHVFSHHGAHVGAGLEGGSYRFHWNTPGAVELKDNFSSKAFVVFHGCNSGFYTAPKLAQSWGVPVAGSFTSTDFQQLHKNGQYYFNNPGQSPAGGWIYGNPVGKRMKADNQPYKGLWGSFAGGGLNFYKFFCSGGEDSRCLNGMAGYMQTFITPYTDVVSIAKDIMCPNDASGRRRAECFAALDNPSATYSPFAGKSLQCDMQKCSAEFKCQYDRNGRPVEGTCSLQNSAGNVTTTFVDEYRRLVRAGSRMGSVEASPSGGFMGWFR